MRLASMEIKLGHFDQASHKLVGELQDLHEAEDESHSPRDDQKPSEFASDLNSDRPMK